MDNIQKENFYNKVNRVIPKCQKKIISCSKYDDGILIL